MTYWNNKYKADSSDNTIQSIKSDIQDLMRFLAKQKIVKESGCNIKRVLCDFIQKKESLNKTDINKKLFTSNYL